MAVADPITAPSRRKLLAAGAAAGLATLPPMPAGAGKGVAFHDPLAVAPGDLVLVQIRARFLAAREAHDLAAEALCDDRDDAAAVAAEALAWQGYVAALAELEAAPATGLLGLAAKASLVAELRDTCPGDDEAAVIYSLARDASAILGQIAPAAGAASPAPRQSDAELLAAGAAFDRAAAEIPRIQEARRGLTDRAALAGLDDAEDAAYEARREALAAIIQARALTHAGRQVKARALRVYLEDRDDPVERRAASLAADVLGEGAA